MKFAATADKIVVMDTVADALARSSQHVHQALQELALAARGDQEIADARGDLARVAATLSALARRPR